MSGRDHDDPRRMLARQGEVLEQILDNLDELEVRRQPLDAGISELHDGVRTVAPAVHEFRHRAAAFAEAVQRVEAALRAARTRTAR